jgi:hypothetical protein
MSYVHVHLYYAEILLILNCSVILNGKYVYFEGFLREMVCYVSEMMEAADKIYVYSQTLNFIVLCFASRYET